MPNLTRSAHAVCPFYEKSEKNYVRCECVIGGARLLHVFDTERTCKMHFEKFCCSYDYVRCPYALMLIGIWDQSDG